MGAPSPQGGFWGEPDATTDWCEENYQVFSWIAEPWNSASAFGIIFIALIGWKQTHMGAAKSHSDRSSNVLEIRFMLAYVLLFVLGLGTFAFHATLRWQGQALDECPLLSLNCLYIFCLLQSRHPKSCQKRPPPNQVIGILVAIHMVVVALYVYFGLYAIFIAATVSSALFMWYLIVPQIWFFTAPVWKLLIMHLLGLYPAFGLWILEGAKCEQVRHLHLHSWWHLFASWGMHTWIQFLVAVHGEAEGKGNTVIRWVPRIMGYPGPLPLSTFVPP